MRLSLYLLLLFFGNDSFSQTKRHRFNHVGSTAFFETINDTLVCIREEDNQAVYYLFDSSLSLIRNIYLDTKLSASELNRQLLPLSSSIGFIKQRVVKNQFQILTKRIPLNDTIDSEEMINVFEEPLGQRIYSSQVRYDVYQSPGRDYTLLIRLEELPPTKDSLTASLIVLDKNLLPVSSQKLRTAFDPSRQRVFNCEINDSGTAFILIGEDFGSYVLGTSLKLHVYEAVTEKFTDLLIKVPKQKLARSIIRTEKDVIKIISTSQTNRENNDAEINSITEIDISRSSLKYQVSNYSIENDILKKLRRSADASLNGSLNQADIISFKKNNEQIQVIINTVPGIIPAKVYSQEVTSPRVFEYISPAFGSSPVPAISSSERKKPVRIQPHQHTATVVVYGDNLQTAAQILQNNTELMMRNYQPLIYHLDAGPPIVIYAIHHRGSLYLSCGELSNGHLTNRIISDNTNQLIPDGTGGATLIRNRPVFSYQHIKTDEQGILLIK